MCYGSTVDLFLCAAFASAGNIVFVGTKVGSDLSNRQGLGVNVNEVYGLGSDLHKIGWNDGVPDPCCITDKPGSTDLIDFNKRLVAASEGRLPAVDEARMQYFAMSCNHTVWFLKCVGAEMPCVSPGVSINGHLSTALIDEGDPLFAKRVREGMTWMVLNWRVRENYPEIVELIIHCKNAPGEINRRTSVFETLLQIWDLSKKHMDADGYPDWTKVQRLVSRGNPPLSTAAVPDLIDYVVNCSGGKSAPYLLELTDLWSQCQLSKLTRHIPNKLWSGLVNGGQQNLDPMVRLKNMFVMTTLTAQTDTVEDGICTFISPADCQIFGTKKPSTAARLAACSETLNAGFELADKVAVALASGGASAPGASAPVPRALTNADGEGSSFSKQKLLFACRIVRYALSESKNRQRPGEDFMSTEAIGFELLKGLRRLCPITDTVATNTILATWKPDAAAADKAKPKAKPTQGVRLKEMTADGKLAHLGDQMLQRGYQVGEHVKHKAGGGLWVITKIEADCVVLEDLPARIISDKNAKTIEQFLATYTKPPSGYESKLLHNDPSWRRLHPLTSKGGAVVLAKADVLSALTVAARLHPDSQQAVQPLLNLKNANGGVEAASNAKAGSIVLVPWTNNIQIDFPGEESFQKPAQWTVQLKGDASLANFASDEGPPRVSLLSQTFAGDLALQKQAAEKIAPKPQPRKRCSSKTAPAAAEKEQEEEEEQQNEEEEETAKSHTALFWRLQGVTAKDSKNYEKINMDSGFITVDAFGSIVSQTTNIGAKNTDKPDFAASARPTQVEIPVLVNSKDVIKGDPLLYMKMTVVKETNNEPRPIDQRALLRTLLQKGEGPAEPAFKKMKIG